jgi:hypothetical protein
MARLQRPEKFEAKRQKLRLGNESVLFLAFETEITSSSDSKNGDLQVKESLSARDEDNDSNVELSLKQTRRAVAYPSELAFLLTFCGSGP